MADRNRTHRGTKSPPMQILFLGFPVRNVPFESSFHCFSHTFRPLMFMRAFYRQICFYHLLLFSLNFHTHIFPQTSFDLTHFTSFRCFSHTRLLKNSWNVRDPTTPLWTSVNFAFSAFMWVCVSVSEGVQEFVCVLFINLIKAVILNTPKCAASNS